MTTPANDVTATSSSTGLAANVAGALAYVLGPVTGIAFFFIEKENQFVRFHAAQSITVSIILIAASIAVSVVSAVLAVVPILGWLIALALTAALGLASFALWLVLMYKAYAGEEWEVPVAGPLARKLLTSSIAS
jgi:uncharacterized membrane protein